MASGTDLDKIRTTQILGLLLPGFLFGFILCDVFKTGFSGKKAGFIFLSGILYIIIALGSGGAGSMMKIFPVGIIYYCFVSALGALCLYILYYSLIDSNLNLLRGIGFASLLGFAAGIIPALWLYKIEMAHYKRHFDDAGSWMIIFMIWQPLFALSIAFSKKKVT
jgi:hypothetical protein